MDNQQIFDKVATHLLTQNERSVDIDGDCQYRDPQGRSCAVGCLIPDEFYNPAFEGAQVSSAMKYGRKNSLLANALEGAGIDVGNPTTIKLLAELQHMHDNDSPYGWPEDLRDIAMKFGLSTEALDK